MSTLLHHHHLKSGINACNAYKGFNFLPQPTSQLPLSNSLSLMGDVETQSPLVGYQIMGHPVDIRESNGSNDNNNNGGFELQSNDFEHDETEELIKSSGQGGKTGHMKLCARGHWRPAEDAKLKELVAQYGPQNWNLIAENLQGRSGKSLLSKNVELVLVKDCIFMH